MSDSADGSAAWIVSPDEYLRRNPAPYPSGCRTTSQYVAVRDGTRLAVDVHLPLEAPPGARFPTLVIFTPYYRRFRLLEPHPPELEAAPNSGHYRSFFVPHGYAVVVVDVRGSGASFGAREGFRSPAERGDYADIVDWVVAQGWCDGKIGSTGISYVGAAADFLASTGHPAVKAVIPTFSVWDTWIDQFHPGGLLISMLPQGYGEMMEALDLDRRDVLRRYAYFKDPHLAGPAPVDDDPDGTLLRQAIAEHAANFDMLDFMHQFRFRDTPLIENPDFTSATVSPFAYAFGYRRDVAVYGVSGWMDGGGYSNGSIKRHLSLAVAEKRMLLGPWDHGARTHVSPFRKAQVPQFKLLAESLRFLDQHLKGRDTGLAREKPVHYFTLAEEAWKAADSWPVPGTRDVTLFLGDGKILTREKPTVGDAADRYRVDFTIGTGTQTRYERLAARAVETYYPDWHGRDAHMLTWTKSPLEDDFELTGHAVATLHVATTERDGAVILYLEDVAPDGTCRYVTEGVLRLVHRRLGTAPPEHRTAEPYRSFNEPDAELMRPNEVEKLVVPLLPISWLFRKGHRLRLALAGADRDHFSRVPAGRFPTMTIHRDRARPSHIVLPLIRRTKSPPPPAGEG